MIHHLGHMTATHRIIIFPFLSHTPPSFPVVDWMSPVTVSGLWVSEYLTESVWSGGHLKPRHEKRRERTARNYYPPIRMCSSHVLSDTPHSQEESRYMDMSLLSFFVWDSCRSHTSQWKKETCSVSFDQVSYERPQGVFSDCFDPEPVWRVDWPGFRVQNTAFFIHIPLDPEICVPATRRTWGQITVTIESWWRWFDSQWVKPEQIFQRLTQWTRFVDHSMECLQVVKSAVKQLISVVVWILVRIKHAVNFSMFLSVCLHEGISVPAIRSHGVKREERRIRRDSCDLTGGLSDQDLRRISLLIGFFSELIHLVILMLLWVMLLLLHSGTLFVCLLFQ